MSDLISREALKKAFANSEHIKETTDGLDVMEMLAIKEIIDNAPTVEERPQGEWIRTGSLGNGNAQYECSNCHYGDEQAESQEVPYCWHCGAKMQAERSQGEWIRLDLAKRVIDRFKGYLDEDMILRIQIALEKENEANMKGGAEND